MNNASATYDRKLVDMMVADGFAKAFPLRDGTVNYVVKLEDRTFAIRAAQIVDYPPAAFTIVFDDNAAEAALADRELADSAVQDYLAKAEAAGISVEEYTDGEYYVNPHNGRVFPASAREVRA